MQLVRLARLSHRQNPRRGLLLPKLVTDGLVARWAFDDGSGQQLTDYSGNGHHGTLGNSAGADSADPTWGTSPVRLVFDGSNDFVNTAQDISSIDTELHVDLIVRPLASTGDYHSMFVLFVDATFNTSLILFRNADTPNLTYLWGTGDSSRSFVGSVAVFDDDWHHVSLNIGTKNSVPFAEAHVDGAIDISVNEAADPMDIETAYAAFGDISPGDFPMAGDFAYAILNNIQFTDAQEAQHRQFLKNVMASRGVILP